MLLLKHFTIEDFKNTFPLASLGARVCYPDKSLKELLEDLRVVDKQKELNSYQSLTTVNTSPYSLIPLNTKKLVL
jgi:hypothetical protein